MMIGKICIWLVLLTSLVHLLDALKDFPRQHPLPLTQVQLNKVCGETEGLNRPIERVLPWLACVSWGEGPFKISCTGTLINEEYVLTLAHCFSDQHRRRKAKASEVIVHLGYFDFLIDLDTPVPYNVSRVIPHPNFDPRTGDNDIALLRLSRPLWIGHHIAPICLPTLSPPFEDTKPTVNVWKMVKVGDRLIPRLDYLQVDVISNSRCQTAFDEIDVTISESQLCAGRLEGGQGPCYSESGVPLMVLNADGRATAIGMLSDPQCGQPGFVDIYIRITSYLDWIKKNAQIK